MRCIQYFYYWDEQNCKKDHVISEPNTVSSLFGLLFAIVEYTVSYLVIAAFPEIFSIPILDDDNKDGVSQTEFKEFGLGELENEKCRPNLQ